MIIIWYLLLFLGVLLEGELTLSAAVAGMMWGNLSPLWVLPIAWLAAFAGDTLCFHLGRRYGARVFARFPKLQERMKRVVDLLAKRPLLTIIILRFQIGMRTIGHFVLGHSEIDRDSYMKQNLIACFLWSAGNSMLLVGFFMLTDDFWRSLIG